MPLSCLQLTTENFATPEMEKEVQVGGVTTKCP